QRIYESRLIYDGTDEGLDQLYRTALSKLLGVLQVEDAAFRLRSRISDENIVSDIVQLVQRLQKAQGNFKYDNYRPLVHLIIQRPPPESENVKTWNFNVWKAVFTLIDTISQSTPPTTVPPSSDSTPVKSTSSSQKGFEQLRKLVDPRLFEEIHSCTFQDIEDFFDKYFEKKDWSSKADVICQRVLALDSDGRGLLESLATAPSLVLLTCAAA
ncbi:hypothetical protein ACJ72_07914, partial [Emergomyces africanus]